MLRTPACLALLLIAACTPIAVQTPPSTTVGQPPPELPKGEAGDLLSELVDAHNRERAKEKLPPLRPEARLTAAATVHAADMAEHRKMTHEGSDGSDAAKRIERQGYGYQAVAENIAAGQTTVPQVMKDWMNSPKHRENILGDFGEMGAAAVKGKDGQLYWCVDFGKPWPKIDPAAASEALLKELNRRRAEEKAAPLSDDPQLSATALRHAKACASAGKLVQEDEDGKTPLDRLKESGYRFHTLGELMGQGRAEAAEQVKGWFEDMRSRKQLLGPFTRAGVGVATDAKGIPYWCLILAEPAR